MTRRLLVNAVHSEECRVAIADDDRLRELEIERADQNQLRGNIYKASITRIEPSLQAAFLDIGANRNGFLQINDIHPSYFEDWPREESNHNYRPSIQDVLHAGQELAVQVIKDEREAKGATLTTNISIPGRYLVLMVGNQRGGVSRKISDEAQRYKLRQAVQKLVIPPGMGVIVRTAGINKSSSELQRDLDALLDIWFDVLQKNTEPGTPKLLYKESDLAIRTLRDYLTPDIDEILIDHEETYRRASQFLERLMPVFASRLRFHNKLQPLFSAFHLDAQVEAVNQPEVTLPSGGSIVFGITEAVVTIDVNSGRSTGQADVEETAFSTNREAAEMIANQLRLRDLGGLIVIDFIDMSDKRHKQTVEKTLRDAIRLDKAKIEIGRISKFGLLEMSRQRLKSSLASQSQMVCPQCQGRARVKTPESAALDALRKIETVTFSGGVSEIRVRMAPGAALLLLNNKRQLLAQLERETKSSILIFADGRMRPEEYELEIKTRKDSFEQVISDIPKSTPVPQPQPSIREGSPAEDSDQEREDGEEPQQEQRRPYNRYRKGGGGQYGQQNRGRRRFSRRKHHRAPNRSGTETSS